MTFAALINKVSAEESGVAFIVHQSAGRQRAKDVNEVVTFLDNVEQMFDT